MFFDAEIQSVFQSAGDTEVQKSMFLTLWVSMAATLICSVFAIPLAYLIARNEFKLKNLVLGLINIPIISFDSTIFIFILIFHTKLQNK